MDPIAFVIFGKPVYWYGVLISASVLIGIFLALHNAKRFGVEEDPIIDFALLAIPLAIIGARAYYVIFEWNTYKKDFLSVFKIWEGGLAIYGGIIGGIMAAIIFSKRRKISFWNLADIVTPSLVLGQAIGRWGNFFNQEAYGSVVNDVLWQWFPAAVFIEANNQWHLATFFYESIWDFLIFVFLMLYRNYRKQEGDLFNFYLILYAIGRFFIEGLRTDSLYIGNIRVSQLLSVILIVVGVCLFIYRRRNWRRNSRFQSPVAEAILNEDNGESEENAIIGTSINNSKVDDSVESKDDSINE